MIAMYIIVFGGSVAYTVMCILKNNESGTKELRFRHKESVS